jgi:hypothetical protein
MLGNTGFSNATGARSGGGRTGNVIPKGYRQGQLQQFTPEQMQLFQQMFGQLGPDSFLSKLAGGDQSAFEQMEAPALRQFQGLQGQLASRFSGMGTGARRSSGFQNTTNQAASDFAQQLQSNRIGLQEGALQQLHQLANSLLQQKPYEQFLTEKPTSGWQKMLEGIFGGLSGGFGQGFGGKVYKGIFG